MLRRIEVGRAPGVPIYQANPLNQSNTVQLRQCISHSPGRQVSVLPNLAYEQWTAGSGANISPHEQARRVREHPPPGGK